MSVKGTDVKKTIMENRNYFNTLNREGAIELHPLYHQKFNRLAHIFYDYTTYSHEAMSAIFKHYQSNPEFEYFTESRIEDKDLTPFIRRYVITLTNGVLIEAVQRKKDVFDFELYYNGDQIVLNEFIDLIAPYRIKATGDKKKAYLVINTLRGLRLTDFDVKEMNLDVKKHYNDDFSTTHTEVEKFLKNDDSGLVILHGKQGTGKSSYIRHIAGLTDKKVIYFTSDMAQQIASPSFIPFIMEEKGSVIVLEDCEELLAARSGAGRVNTGITNILNMSDGLLGDALNLKFVCTFNAPLKDIDKALLRKGRLIARYEFNDLAPEKANALIAEQNLDVPQQLSPISLADLYHYEKPGFEQMKRAIGF